MPIYAHCPVCGHDFESWGLSIVGASSTQANLAGVGETCPRCGSIARIMEGSFNISDDEIEVLDAPQWSRDLVIRLSKKSIHRLRSAASWAEQQAGSDSDEHRAVVLEKTIEATAPQLTPVLSALRAKLKHEYDNHLAAWVTALIALITLIVTLSNQQGISGDQLEQILDETVRHVQHEQDPKENEDPTQSVPPTPGPEEPPTVTELPTPTTH